VRQREAAAEPQGEARDARSLHQRRAQTRTHSLLERAKTMVRSNKGNAGKLLATPGGTHLRLAGAAAATLIWSASAAWAQVDLTTYTDANGYLNVRALTCAQLANTYQEDANFLGAWYSGWYNGRFKKHSINIARAKQGLHEVIVYCKVNHDKKVVDAVSDFVKKAQAGAK
jgi:HdeA/HdeB family